MMFWNNVAAWIGLTFVYIYNYLSTNGFILVEIDKGILRGRNASTWLGTSYFSFKGIPYAKPPIEELRFKAPQEESPWNGIRDAVFHGEVCPQMDMAFRNYRGEEDCLFLNVYTPTLRDERLPVMFWIHGGMFMLASGNDELYGPDYFMDGRNVVLVTINYRLGALGFLSTGDDEVPGNAGMKDQVAALKWVRRNIANFGGDPDSVTLFGGSSGAACVHYHLLSPMSKGLFAKAISQSGSALNNWALTVNSAENTIRLVKALGAKNFTAGTAGAIDFLRSASSEDIVKVQGSLLTAAEARKRVELLFIPSVEKGVNSEEVFLPNPPMKILESGNFNKVPYITGHTSHEGYFFMNEIERPGTMLSAFQDTERYVPIDIKRGRNYLAKSIRKYYFDDKPIGIGNISNIVDLYSDVTFVTGIKRAAKLQQLKSTETPIFFYVFSHNDELNLVKFFMNIDRPGAVHGDELGYLFHHKLLAWRTPKKGSSNQHTVNTMIRLWTNFAKYGNPTPPGDPLNWKPLTNETFNYLNISGLGIHPAVNPDADRDKFWEKSYDMFFAPHNNVCSQSASCECRKNWNDNHTISNSICW